MAQDGQATAGNGEQHASLRPGLRRSRRQKVLGGVCGGLGGYLGIDPVIFRVVLTMLALTGGIGLISYGIGWLLIPAESEQETEVQRLLSGRVEGSSLTAVFLTLVGSALFLSSIDNGDNQAFSLCLVAATVGAVYWSQRRRSTAATTAETSATASGGPASTARGGGAPPAAQPPPDRMPSWWRTVPGECSGPAEHPGRGTGYLWGPDDSDEPVAYESAPPRCARPERSLPGILISLVALFAATIGMSATWGRLPLGTTVEIGLTAALTVFGVGLVAGAFAGRRGGGTLFLAVLTSLLLVGAAALPKSIGTQWHRATWQPAAVAQVQPRYQLDAGQGTLDLSGLALHGGAVETTVEVGVGQVRVRVPQDATVRLTVKVGLGKVRFPAGGPPDLPVTTGQDRTLQLDPPSGTPPGGIIRLQVQLGMGQVEVLRGG